MATLGNQPKPEIIEEFCKRWKVQELSLFGSILRDDFNAASDVDVMVAFEENSGWSLLDHVAMRDELATLFDRKVDLVTRKGVEKSRNLLRRTAILDSAKVFYAAT